MRQYDIVSGILLILSIIDFALAAPVLVQGKLQERVDVVHIPNDMITVFGKRWEQDLEKMWEEYFDESGNLESPASHISSSSAPSEPDHESTNVEHAPAPNPASPTTNPDLLMEPPSSSLPVSTQSPWWNRINAMWDSTLSQKGDNELHWPQYSPTSSGYGSDREFMEMHMDHPRPSTDSDLSTDPDFDWNYWKNEHSPSLGAGSPMEPEHEVATPPSPNPGSPKEPEDEVVPGPPPSPNPELPLDHRSLSADSQPEDL